MPDYRVLPYSPERLPDIEALWREHVDDDEAVENRRKYFRWLTECNPFLSGESAYYLFLDGDRVIGMHGHMPQLISVNGRPQRFYLAHDDLLSVECRGKGLGKVMLDGVAGLNDSFAGSLWHNTRNRKLYAKSGWLDCSKLLSCTWIIDPRRHLQLRLGRNPLTHAISFLLKKVWSVRNALRRIGRSKDYRAIEIDRFDDQFDELFERVARTLPIAVVRNAAYLNWKFVEKPENRYRRIAAIDSAGVMRAYIVVSAGEKSEEPVGKVLDFLGDPDHPEALDVVIRRGLEWLQSQEVVTVTCVGSPRAMACLGRFGFRQQLSKTGFMFIHWESAFDREFVTNINNWYITASDADGDAWKPT